MFVECCFWSLIASECRSWVLYYGIPVLQDILPIPYLHHFAKLVTSMHICFSEKINRQQLFLMEQLLKSFYSGFEELYGKPAYPYV